MVDLYAVWVSNQEIQQVYQDQLEEFYNRYSAENYYNEDWSELEGARQTAGKAIEDAGSDEAVMQQALETAIAAIQAVPSKEERAGEVAEGWESAHRSLLNQMGAVIPMEELDSREDRQRGGPGRCPAPAVGKIQHFAGCGQPTERRRGSPEPFERRNRRAGRDGSGHHLAGICPGLAGSASGTGAVRG